MDDDGSFSMRHWGYYGAPSRGNLALQLMSNVTSERDIKPLISHGSFFHRDGSVPDPPASMGYQHPVYNNVLNHRDNKFMHVYNSPGYGVLPDASGTQTIQMLQPHDHEPPKEEEEPMIDEANGHNDAPLKKRSQGCTVKSPKPKKPKKVNNQARDNPNGTVSKGKADKKSTGLVINGIDLDLSGIPTPVCSCTGNPQQCYRWGVGGWQSACCTISICQYPLPMSFKRKGARIAGRKMSQGAFKKVLERLAGEGHNLSNPIDLKTFWAKHGTNKFVTIR